MNKINLNKIICALFFAIVVAVLYGQFLRNPIIFDDIGLFLEDGSGVQPLDHFVFLLAQFRSLPYASLSWTKELFGFNLIYFRLGNLALHLLNTLVLYGVLKTVFSACYTSKNKISLSDEQAALLGAALFAFHPVVTYAVGYLVQRTILMATLFSLVTMLIYSRAYLTGKRAVLWLSVPFYYLAIFSKEHAVMLFAIMLALSVLLDADWRARLRTQWGALALMFCISVLVVVAKKELLGATYEIEAKRMLGEDFGPLAYPYSVITQCGLFFKYALLWVLPNINWMSIDMRETFASSIWSLRLGGVFLYITWGITAINLLLKRGNKGLVGFAMFFPWILFFTELAAVRIQEPFVLYRSYFWAIGAFFAIPIALNGIEKKLVAVVSAAVLATFFILSMERLITMSQPILLWADALKLVDGRSDLHGVDRIYYNLGISYMKSDMLTEAEGNLKKAIVANPDSAQAHAALGGSYNMRHQWQEAVSEYTQAEGIEQRLSGLPNWRYFAGRARAHEGAGELSEAAQDYVAACHINMTVCENIRKSSLQK